MLVRRLRPGPVDIVGDVHGEIDALGALLESLGYDANGNHPQGRRAVFVGDLTDRGPDSVAVAELVMAWTDRGAADCALGNHELNILRNEPKAGNAWIIDPSRKEQQPGGEFAHCRVADAAFRVRFQEWLATLPVALERDDLRVIHAAWLHDEIAALRTSEMSALATFEHYETAVQSALTMEGVRARADTEEAEWGESLHQKHAKVPLLPALGECDERYQMGNPLRVATSGAERMASTPFWSSGKWRMADRVRWWEEYTDDVPVVVGHYWRRLALISGSKHAAGKPDLFHGVAPTAWLGPKANVFCVDYSVGARYEERKKGKNTLREFETRLMAMRWPERELWAEDGRVLS